MGHNQHFRVHLQTNVWKTHVPDLSQAAVRSPPGESDPACGGNGTCVSEMQSWEYKTEWFTPKHKAN